MKAKRKVRSLNKTTPKVKKSKRVPRSQLSPVWLVIHGKNSPIDNIEIIDKIREGVKKTAWKELIGEIGHTEKELESILPSSISSMQKKSVYDKETSERIYELAKLYSLGYNVFDSEESFKRWLKSPSKALGGRRPFDLLDSSFGFELVENEITRIQYNVYS